MNNKVTIIFLVIFCFTLQKGRSQKRIQKGSIHDEKNSEIDSLTSLWIGQKFNPLVSIQNNLKYKNQLIEKYNKATFYGNLRQAYSFLCDHKNALKYDELFYLSCGFPEEKYQGEINYQLFDFSKELLKVADNYKVILINESHNFAYHRLTTYKMLHLLKDKKYSIFMAETFNEDISKKENVLAMNNEIGTYTNEPIFSELVREANKLNYELNSYEATSEDFENHLNRDSMQAVHIYNIIQQNPTKKVIIHAGFGHIYEDSSFIGKTMGYYLKHLLHEDILTIDQTKLNESFLHKYETQLYKQIIKKEKLEELMLVKSTSKNQSQNYNETDWFIIHPKAKFINGRPTYYAVFDSKKVVSFPISDTSINLVQLYYADEYNLLKDFDKMIACDNQIVDAKKEVYLFVPKNKDVYIVYRDKENGIINSLLLKK